MRVDVLGPVRVVSGPKIIETPSRAERALLAALALHVGETVPLSQALHRPVGRGSTVERDQVAAQPPVQAADSAGQ